MKIYTACKQSGDFIEEVKNIEQGKKLIEKYEKEDKKDRIYEPDFYELENEKHHTLEV